MRTDERGARRLALVVEYDRWERAFTTEVLAAEGYDVLGASNGASGLRLAECHACDVILLDVVLPELGACQVLQHLKSTGTTRHVPVILVGSPSEEDERLAAGVLGKPLAGARVVEEVDRVLAHHAGLEQPAASAPRDGVVPPRHRRPSDPLVLVASADARAANRLAERA